MNLQKLLNKLMGITEFPRVLLELERHGFRETEELKSPRYCMMQHKKQKILYDKERDEVVRYMEIRRKK